MTTNSMKEPSVFPDEAVSGTIAALEQYLERQDMVILVDIDGVNFLVDLLCHSKAISNTSKQLVVISTENYPVKPGNHIYLTVSEKEMRAFLDLYRLYESSDKLVLLTDSRNYGTLWNYVNNGIMSAEEVLEAILV